MEFHAEGSRAQDIDFKKLRPHKHPDYFKLKFALIVSTIVALLAEFSALRMENDVEIKKIVEYVCYLSIGLAMFDIYLEYHQPYWVPVKIFNVTWRATEDGTDVFLVPVLILLGMCAALYVLVCLKWNVKTALNLHYVAIWVSATQFLHMLQKFMESFLWDRYLIHSRQIHQELPKTQPKAKEHRSGTDLSNNFISRW